MSLPKLLTLLLNLSEFAPIGRLSDIASVALARFSLNIDSCGVENFDLILFTVSFHLSLF